MPTARSRATVSAQLQLTGPGAAGATDQGWGVDPHRATRSGDTATLSEQVTLIDPTHVHQHGGRDERQRRRRRTSRSAPAMQIDLSQVHNTATITNTVTCDSRLTLIKQVQGGDALAGSWTLNASFLATRRDPDRAPRILRSVRQRCGHVATVTPNARYQLFETGGDPRYAQTDNRTNLQSNPLSTGSATCIRVNADGTPFAGSGFSDGINGGVNVPLGYRVACTFVNQTAVAHAAQERRQRQRRFRHASAWDLTATPAPLTVSSPRRSTGPRSSVPASTFPVRPDHVYTLTESTSPATSSRSCSSSSTARGWMSWPTPTPLGTRGRTAPATG